MSAIPLHIPVLLRWWGPCTVGLLQCNTLCEQRGENLCPGGSNAASALRRAHPPQSYPHSPPVTAHPPAPSPHCPQASPHPASLHSFLVPPALPGSRILLGLRRILPVAPCILPGPPASSPAPLASLHCFPPAYQAEGDAQHPGQQAKTKNQAMSNLHAGCTCICTSYIQPANQSSYERRSDWRRNGVHIPKERRRNRATVNGKLGQGTNTRRNKVQMEKNFILDPEHTDCTMNKLYDLW